MFILICLGNFDDVFTLTGLLNSIYVRLGIGVYIPYVCLFRSKNIHKYFSLEAPERVLSALFVYRPRTKTGYLFKPQKRYHFCVFPAIHRKFPARKYNLLGFRKLGNTLEFLCYLVIKELPNFCYITIYSYIMSVYRYLRVILIVFL